MAPLPHGLTEDEKRSYNLEYTEIYQQAKAAFDAIVAEIRSAHDPSDFLVAGLGATKILQIAQQAGPGHALVYLAATPWGGIAVGVLNAHSSVSGEDCFVSLDLPHLTTDFVDHLVESHLQRRYTTYHWWLCSCTGGQCLGLDTTGLARRDVSATSRGIAWSV